MMRILGCLILVWVAACRYGGPLAGGGSEIREGTLPDRVARLLNEAGGDRSATAALSASAPDSAAIFLLAIDQRALGLRTAQVAVLPRNESTSKFPREGWRSVDSFGVYAERFAPGEYVVFVQDPRHWAARKVIRLRAGGVDTLLAIMRSGVQQGDRSFPAFPP